MKILIIGSKGFIGSHCVTHFSKAHDVWQCDVVVDYTTPNYFLLDATNANFDAVFERQNFDICINCSGAASVPDSIKNPHRDFSLNVYNVFRQLDAIRKHSPNCKYINFSSAAVYGNPQSLPIDELHSLEPISPYGTHKQMSEGICREFYENFGIGTCSLRVFSAYGPGLKKQLFWDLYQKSRGQNEVQLYGTGLESRDFIYITDLVHAIDCIIKKTSFANDIINVANGEEIYIKEAVANFYDVENGKITYNFGGEGRKGDPINWVANISKLRAMGYEPKVDLKSGITKFWEWLNEEG